MCLTGQRRAKDQLTKGLSDRELWTADARQRYAWTRCRAGLT